MILKSTPAKNSKWGYRFTKIRAITCDEISIIDTDIYAQKIHYSPEDNSILISKQ